MELHLPTLLLVCAAVLGLAASVLHGAALTQAVYRGHTFWVWATWGLTLGVALESLREQAPGASLAAHLLLLQWPVVVLMGLRRFDARLRLPGQPRGDLTLLGLAMAGVLLMDILAAGSALALWTYTLLSALLHGYAGALLLAVAPLAGTPALRPLGALMALLAAALLARSLLALDTLAPPDAVRQHAITLTLGGVAFAFLAMHATYERTEALLRESRRRLKVLANIDMLTKVPNRRHFHELAQRCIERDAPGSAAVVMFDIDHFKAINDLQGHAAGDRALKLVSRCVQQVLRQQDVSGRHGGDEFVLLLPRTAALDALGVARRIVAQVQARAQAAQMTPLSLSFGVVQMVADETVDEALRRADQALYEAKRQGRSRAVLAEGDEDQPVFSESQRLGLTPN